jgi:hypothetical protein
MSHEFFSFQVLLWVQTAVPIVTSGHFHGNILQNGPTFPWVAQPWAPLSPNCLCDHIRESWNVQAAKACRDRNCDLIKQKMPRKGKGLGVLESQAWSTADFTLDLESHVC